MLTDEINKFSNPVVRDLVWAIASPPLLQLVDSGCTWPDSAWYQHQLEQRRDWLLLQDRNPEALQELVASRKDRRLGKYFETLWFYWLDNHPQYRVLYHNLQIVIESRTIGEMDFIVQDISTNEIIHLELAVKFYLGADDLENPANWHGPHRKDRLDIKLKHLLSRQTRISQRAAVRQWLHSMGVKIDRCVVIIKGRLYYPAVIPGPGLQPVTRVESPAVSSADHLKGQWVRRGHLLLADSPGERFLPLINSGWMADLPTYDEAQAIGIAEMSEIGSKNSLHLPLHVKAISHCLFEDKLFVVDDTWGKGVI